MKNKIIKKWLVMLVFVFSFFVFNNAQAQVWQETLENQFDYVSTFDELQDWHAGTLGESGNSGLFTTELTSQPKKLDGSPSMWTMWQTDVPGYEGGEEWIGPRADASNVWQGAKSLCIAYKNLRSADAPNTGEKGPAHLATFIGDGVTGKSGLKNLHLFYMLKLPTGYFRPKLDPADGYETPPTVKDIQMLSGFTEMMRWGTEEDRATVPIDNGAVLRSYGMNTHIPTITGGGDSNPQELYAKDTWLMPNETLTGYQAHLLSPVIWQNNSFVAMYEAQEWVGIEWSIIRGDVDIPNGSIRQTIYDEHGNVLSSSIIENEILMSHYDHYWNKIVFGGNWNSSTEDRDTDITHYYVDDAIIDDVEIAPTYFSLLNSQSIPETCSDNIQNQDETGIDCGGVCDACEIPITYGLSNFISAITNWLQIGNTESDVNSDGIVNTRDLGVVMSNWSN